MIFPTSNHSFANSTVGEDVEVGVGRVTLDRATLSASVPIIPLFDIIYEADQEFFTVRIVDVVGGQIDPDTSTATVAVIDETCEYIQRSLLPNSVNI